MLGINSFISPYRLSGAQFSEGASAQTPDSSQTSINNPARRAPGQDSYEPGQAWKNRATAGSPAAQTAAPDPFQRAARAYARNQPEAGAPVAASPAPAGEKKIPAEGERAVGNDQPERAEGGEVVEKKPVGGDAFAPRGMDGEPLSRAEQSQIAKLKQIDSAVKGHEMAHLATAGSYARGGAVYSYVKGADGMSYAVGGEVGIDTSKESTPAKTIAKMQVVRAAALAPADPSSQDRKVAAQAMAAMAEASMEMMQLAREMAEATMKAGPAGATAGPAAESAKQAEPAEAAKPSESTQPAENGRGREGGNDKTVDAAQSRVPNRIRNYQAAFGLNGVASRSGGFNIAI